VVLWQGLIDLSRDIPNSDVDLLASRNRLLVRQDLHPALQYLLLEAMREVHWPAGTFNRLGEFPAEQPNDLPLSGTAEAFYRSGPTFWQRYTSFWFTSLLNRIVFFVIPFVALMIPLIGFARPFYRWLHMRRIDQLHRALGKPLVEWDCKLTVRQPLVQPSFKQGLGFVHSCLRLMRAGTCAGPNSPCMLHPTRVGRGNLYFPIMPVLTLLPSQSRAQLRQPN
jgi:hypothetical protein